MNKKVVIISATPRVNGNSHVLSEKFKKGAEDVGNEVELISLRENKINYCIGCYYCQTNGKCFQNDGMNEILEKIVEADVLVFATPVYFYDVVGQMKTFIDRIFPKYEKIKNKDMYLIATAGENNKEAVSGAIDTVNRFLDCVENVELKGVLYGIGLHGVGEAENSVKSKEAYEMGRNI